MRNDLWLALVSLSVACGPAPAANDADVARVDASASDAAFVDGGPPRDAGDVEPPLDAWVEPPTLGEPIELPPDQLGQWVWITMPEMQCSDGSVGGFAVNFTDASRDLVIYLQGGGICYNALTCAVGGAPSSVGADPLRTALDGTIREYRGIFDRNDTSNPLRDSSFVVLPHCTGDHHTGNQVSTYGGRMYHHVGYTNITRMLERIVPTFADATRVVLSGFSAGGVGISANYHQLATAFESVGQPPPYLIIDAGPFMRPPFLEESAQSTLRDSWGLDGTIGTFCPSCLTVGYHDIYRVNALRHPGLRASLVCTYEDSVVRLLYGVLNGGAFTRSQMREGLHDLADWSDTTAPSVGPSQFEVFYYEGERHGALNVDALSATPGLAGFLDAQLGGGAWDSVRPGSERSSRCCWPAARRVGSVRATGAGGSMRRRRATRRPMTEGRTRAQHALMQARMRWSSPTPAASRRGSRSSSGHASSSAS
jgi:hypothetical protein